ncbi:MAG: hypothetical protein ACREX0_07975 [Noviherbaspirillum sp.]
MSTFTIASPASTGNGLSYAENVGRAARGLLAALLAVKPQADVAATASAAPAAKGKVRGDLSLYELYRLAGSYDSLMPNLAQELRAIASRN